MTQLCMFLGYARGGFWGGLLAGLCFVLPAFGIMLVLTVIYAHVGATPIMRGGLYGLGPVVVGIFVVAVYRLSRSEFSRRFPKLSLPLQRRLRWRSAPLVLCEL